MNIPQSPNGHKPVSCQICNENYTCPDCRDREEAQSNAELAELLRGRGDYLRDHPPRATPPPAPMPAEPASATPFGLQAIPWRVFIDRHPNMQSELIFGLLRMGETMNVIAATKVGKSWLVLALAFAVGSGTPWLGFQTQRGRVLIIDNELHPQTIASRLRRVAKAYGIAESDIDVLALRGRLQNLRSLGEYIKTIPKGKYALVIIDAWYRCLPSGTDENDNGAVAELYNLIDNYAEQLGCSFALIHHASKGNQSAKAITDVGSGAGSQSRAADTHLILRPHTVDNIVVLAAEVRSFPPIAPKCLQWDYPTFTEAHGFDPDNLRASQQRKKKKKSADEKSEPTAPPKPEWSAKLFADTFGTIEPKTKAVIIDDAITGGLPRSQVEHLLKVAIDRKFLFSSQNGKASPMFISTVMPPIAQEPEQLLPLPERSNVEKTKAKQTPPKIKRRQKGAN